VLNKFADLAHFFIRQHLFTRLESFERIPSASKSKPIKKNLRGTFE
jgi:hypothetical protein